MMTITIVQEIQEGDSRLRRTASLETDNDNIPCEEMTGRLVALLKETSWTEPTSL